MAELATITIRRQILDVEVHGTESAGLALQRRLPVVCADVLSPALESALARFDPGDAYLCVERLAIDLSSSSLERLDAELAEAVEREVVDYFLRNPPPPSEVAGTGRVGDVQWRTAAETVDEALVEFLRTGRLPWSFRMPSGSRLEQLVLDTWNAADTRPAPPPRTRAALMEVLAQSSARARLIMQFTPEFVTTVLRGMSPQLAAAMEEVLTAIDEIDSPSPSRVTFTRRVSNAALVAASVRGGRPPGPSELAGTAWRTLDPVERDDPTLATFVEARWPGITKQRESLPVGADGETSQSMPSSPPMDDAEESHGILVDDAEESHGILVDNAGVVLLHPFLPRFLEGLGVAATDELVDPDRALCLLHYLATGESTAPEHQLTVAKILCDVPLDEPVEAEVGITTTEREEATALLQAAIGHWNALLNTSPDALRGEFLTRPGQLSLDAGGDWLLRVETRTVDILLDHLPWGISLINLPWMSRLMRVEWR